MWKLEQVFGRQDPYLLLARGQTKMLVALSENFDFTS